MQVHPQITKITIHLEGREISDLYRLLSDEADADVYPETWKLYIKLTELGMTV